MSRTLPSLLFMIALLAASCDAGPPSADASAGAGGAAGATEMMDLRVPVPDAGRVYVNLSTASVVVPDGDPAASPAWDLAFQGYDVYTNSGPSGAGDGGAFGPLDTSVLLSDAAPEVPFIEADEAGGAFLDWYEYAGTTHVLYSRFHVYGVRNELGTWKVQLLTYYGARSGAPTSALYQIRYADTASGDPVTLQIDGTAGGLQAAADAPSGCLDLASGAIAMLEPAAAQASAAWDLCFRRDAVSVNGEAGGPRGTGAVDLQASATATETLAAVEALTADGTQAQFDAVGVADFAAATFRGDHIVSAFERGGWLIAATPPAPAIAAWLVVDASGQHQFLVSFSSLENPSTSSAGTIVMRIKPVNG